MKDIGKENAKPVKVRTETMEKLNKIASNQIWSKTTTIDVAISDLYNKIFGSQSRQSRNK